MGIFRSTEQQMRDAIAAELREGEQVLDSIAGTCNTSDDLMLVLTDTRALAHIRSFCSRRTLSWNHENITAIGSGRELFSGSLVFTVPGDQFVAKGLNKKDAARFRQSVETVLRDRVLPTSGGGARPSSPTQRLLHLDELRQEGLISEGEYAQLRHQVLASL